MTSLRATLVSLLAALAVASCAPAPPPPPPPPPGPAPAPPGAQPPPPGAQPLAPTAGAPYAPPCQQPEGTCGWARCNVQAGRCLWPCQGDGDCVTGARCLGPPGLSQCVGLGLPAPR